MFLKKVKKIPPGQQLPEATEARIKAAMERLKDRDAVVLALIPSSKKGNPPYPIMLGRNNAIWCKCNGFKYRSECRHMERFRRVISQSWLPKEEEAPASSANGVGPKRDMPSWPSLVRWCPSRRRCR
jgi:hypothetical protein